MTVLLVIAYAFYAWAFYDYYIKEDK